jgi:integrase
MRLSGSHPDRTRGEIGGRLPKVSERVLATDRELKAAAATQGRADFRIKGAPALQLRVTTRGTKTWALAYKSPLTGKWSKTAIGTYPDMGLAEAKDRAQEVSVAVRKGADPVHDKRRRSLLESFEDLSCAYMHEHQSRNARNGQRSKSSQEAQRLLDKDILPKIGRMRAELIKRHHVMEVVEAVAKREAYVAADRTLGLIRAIFNWACGSGRLDQNPTLGLKRRGTSRPKTRTLSPAEIKTFWRASEDLKGMTAPIRDALRLQLLTGLRINEITEASRSEIDFEGLIWVIPAERTKSEREHHLPLSKPAIALIRRIITREDFEEERRARRYNEQYSKPRLLFPSRVRRRRRAPGDKPLKWQRRVPGALDPHAASRCLVRCRDDFRKAGIKDQFNTHDLRRTVATQLGELGCADGIIERILNHAPRTVSGKHYNHAKYLPQMQAALDAWARGLAAFVGENITTHLQPDAA